MEPASTTIAPPDESRSLTGLRGIAATLVMLHHFHLHLALERHFPVLQWLFRKGYLGVDLFFVLSGFVMAMVYGGWFDGSRAVRPSEVLRFVGRRLARLWPVHAVVLLLLLLADLAPSQHLPSAKMLLANFALIQAWGVSTALNPPAWSASTELMAYLLFPLLAAMGLRRRGGGWSYAVLILACLAVCMEYAPPLGPARRGQMDLYFNDSLLPLLRCLAGFMAGMLAWRLGRLPWLRALADTAWFGPTMLLAFTGMALGRVNDLVIIPLLPLIVMGLHFGRGPVHRVLASAPLHRLGVLSYATYLLHYCLLSLFPFDWASPVLVVPAYVATTLVLAAILHRLVEQPGRRLIRGITDRAAGLLTRGAGPRGGPG